MLNQEGVLVEGGDCIKYVFKDYFSSRWSLHHPISNAALPKFRGHLSTNESTWISRPMTREEIFTVVRTGTNGLLKDDEELMAHIYNV